MFTLDEMKARLEGELPLKRYIHSINVMKAAVELAKRYGADIHKAAVAGLLHDCAKGLTEDRIFELCHYYKIETNLLTLQQPELLHGPLGAAMAEDIYSVEDTDILHAIYFHTTGCEDMSLLDKVIFLADYIEQGRDFEGVAEIREKAYNNIDEAVLLSMDCTIKHVLSKRSLLYPATLDARNYIILERIMKGENK